MSATDLAFIRAYAAPGAPAATASYTAPPRSAPAALQGDPDNYAQQPTSTAAVSQRAVSRATSIHIGLGSVVPQPHADFANKIAATMAAGAQQSGIGLAAPMLSAAISPGTRAPLSAFSAQISATAANSASLKPALEIDAVRWPTVCEQLLTRYPERFDRLVDELRQEISAGNRILAITGTHRREGRTTLALCLAQRLAAANVKLALVDADFANPRLAAQLGIGVQRGWESVLVGDESPSGVMIESLADRLALLPLGGLLTLDDLAGGIYRIAATLHELAEHYELVLVDAGPIGLDDATTHWLFESTVGVQSVIMAYDARRSEPHQVAAGCLQLAAAGLRQLGLAEMFVEEPLVNAR